MEEKKNKEEKKDGEEEGEEEENILDIKPNLPIQHLEANWDMTSLEKIEKSTFIDRKPKVLKTSFRDFFRYQNPLRKEDPLQESSRNPEINTLSLAGSKELMASGYSNGEIHIFNKYHDLKVIQHSYDTILGLKINPNNNNILISISSMGDVIHTHVGTAKKLNEFRIEDLVPRCMDFSPLNNKVAVGFAEANINIYNDEMQTFENKIDSGTSFSTGHVNQIHSVVFDKNDRNVLASGGRDRRVMLWDLRNLECTSMVVYPVILGDTVDIKGNYVICGSYEKKDGCFLYDRRKFKEPIKTFKTESQIYTCKFSKKDKAEIFAAGGYNRNNVKIYNINEKEYVSGIEGSDTACYALDFSTDGSVLAYGCKDGGIRIIDL